VGTTTVGVATATEAVDTGVTGRLAGTCRVQPTASIADMRTSAMIKAGDLFINRASLHG
jgi:hypothetical protein